MSKTDSLAALLPVSAAQVRLDTRRCIGLIIVDEVNGFCTIGAGPLAPPAPNAQISRMVAETETLARHFTDIALPVLAFLDTHTAGKAEPPYPPHCEIGTGQELLVPGLRWLESSPMATLIRKDCINGFVGAMRRNSNIVLDWITRHGVETVVVVGICTDICVLQFVQTLLSARNHGLTGPLKTVVVHEPGCATYDLPLEVARKSGLPDTAAHPQDAAHRVGLYLMQASGAVISDRLSLRTSCGEAEISGGAAALSGAPRSGTEMAEA